MRKIIRKIGLKLVKAIFPNTYTDDGLVTAHNHDFIKEPDFVRAYARGQKNDPQHIRWHWRVHVGLWVAEQVKYLDGGYVECGVHRGFLSAAIMEHLNWNRLNKEFYLFDTFKGFDHSVVSEEEKKAGRIEVHAGYYEECFEEVKASFSDFKNVIFVRGSIPQSLSQVEIERVCYLSLDMNLVIPEMAAIRFFWDKIVPGGMVLLDDYAYKGYILQKKAYDEFCREKNVRILSLPTGQGLLIKPRHT